MKTVSVGKIAQVLSLEILAGENNLGSKVSKNKAHRPGLEFIGHFDFFPMERVQVLGLAEITYLKQLSEEERKLRIGNIVNYHPPCFIVTRGQEELTYLVQYCEQENIPLLRTNDSTYEFIAKLDAYLAKALAEEIAVPGVCLNVFGIGILLRGESGIGKSETAYTLIGRGHRLVADDIVVLRKLSHQTILGTHNEMNKEFLALRSVGLLNIVKVYGNKAFQDETRIALDIELTKWGENELHNDLEMKTEYTNYMGVEIPHIKIQLQPGRDVAGLIEAAANSWVLKQQGYSAAEEFINRTENYNN
ncbi:HPr(Ser) kinase/phosphatase [Oceanobacillus luteolus]|uniref:HPr kinase/phosphorylase n=1 Tax=Oceanobacillus luteolus TaxID=1274358 RepID=A0ABW4HM08_9BACI|nr:HPr(Ser) kinase/phosphatase [Oceanobacillus luteolus]MCM3740694.1 HPr(Ser) kinase/phosphatase [Oceanobacillus luteolus]